MEQSTATARFCVARTRGLAATAASALRAAVASVDKDQPVFVVTSMQELLDHSLARQGFTMAMLAVFGLLSLTLAALGTYGVVSYSVTRRSHELALRAALGGRPLGEILLVLKQGASLTLVGLGIGLGAALLLMRFLTSLLNQVRPYDPATLAAVCLALGGSALVACFVPARRVTRVDPVEALRQE